MKNIFVLAALLAGGLTGCAGETAKLTTDKDKSGYALGYEVGGNLKGRMTDVDTDAFARGVQDGLHGTTPALTAEEMNGAKEKFRVQMAQKFQTTVEENRKRGAEYLAKNKAKPGVKVLASGVQYKVVKAGNGKSPKPTDTVTVHYRGTLVNGTEFDSSYKRGEPATFLVNGVIKGWQEVLPLMKAGAKWEVAIPPTSAYGERGAGGAIGPNETLLFEIELLSVK